MNMPKTQTVNNKAIVLSAVCLSLLCASTHTFAKTTDVILPSVLVQREYTTEEALSLKRYGNGLRQRLNVANAYKAISENPNTEPVLRKQMLWAYNSEITRFQLESKYECWNEYVFSKTKGQYSDTCTLIARRPKAAQNDENWRGAYNAYLAGDKLSISEQRSLAETRKKAERTTNFEIARDRRIEQEADSKDAEYAKHPY